MTSYHHHQRSPSVCARPVCAVRLPFAPCDEKRPPQLVAPADECPLDTFGAHQKCSKSVPLVPDTGNVGFYDNAVLSGNGRILVAGAPEQSSPTPPADPCTCDSDVEPPPYVVNGEAYIFCRETTVCAKGTWLLKQRLSSPLPQDGSQFGAGVATTVDGLRVAVAQPAYQDESSPPEVGAVHIFEFPCNGTCYKSVQTLVRPLGFDVDGIGPFGQAIALSPDGSVLLIGDDSFVYIYEDGPCFSTSKRHTNFVLRARIGRISSEGNPLLTLALSERGFVVAIGDADVRIFRRCVNAWTLAQTLTATDAWPNGLSGQNPAPVPPPLCATTDQPPPPPQNGVVCQAIAVIGFGSALSLTRTGDRLAIGAPTSFVQQITYANGIPIEDPIFLQVGLVRTYRVDCATQLFAAEQELFATKRVDPPPPAPTTQVTTPCHGVQQVQHCKPCVQSATTQCDPFAGGFFGRKIVFAYDGDTLLVSEPGRLIEDVEQYPRSGTATTASRTCETVEVSVVGVAYVFERAPAVSAQAPATFRCTPPLQFAQRLELPPAPPLPPPVPTKGVCCCPSTGCCPENACGEPVCDLLPTVFFAQMRIGVEVRDPVSGCVMRCVPVNSFFDVVLTVQDVRFTALGVNDVSADLTFDACRTKTLATDAEDPQPNGFEFSAPYTSNTTGHVNASAGVVLDICAQTSAPMNLGDGTFDVLRLRFYACATGTAAFATRAQVNGTCVNVLYDSLPATTVAYQCQRITIYDAAKPASVQCNPLLCAKPVAVRPRETYANGAATLSGDGTVLALGSQPPENVIQGAACTGEVLFIEARGSLYK